MNFEGYEGTAIDVEMFNQSEGNVTTTEMTEPNQIESAETIDSNTVETAEQNEPEVTPTEVDIAGLGKVSFDEIKEWKQGYLRQSDYTRKTQELARQREQLQNAENLFNYVNQNPHLIDAMKNAEGGNAPPIHNSTPEMQMMRQLAYNQKAMEVDMKVNQLKQKYGSENVDEVALFNKAAELKTEDLEFVYQGLKAAEASPTVDIEEIKRQAIEQAKEELKRELEANKTAVGNTIVSTQPQPIETQKTLSPDQKRIAAAMGMTEEEYIKWM